jgi:aryl-alcohol dehydrogenase-like predicted oxidoreductase
MKAIGIQRANGWPAFIAVQNYYNLLNREDERELLPMCASEGVGVNPWSPLARGRLTRPWSGEPLTSRAESDESGRRMFANTEAIDKPVVDQVSEIATERSLPPSQIALAWMFSKAAIASPVVGATKLGHLSDAVGSCSITLSQSEIDRLEGPYKAHRLHQTRDYYFGLKE